MRANWGNVDEKSQAGSRRKKNKDKSVDTAA
jgi:hypothetical protein